MEDTSNKAGNTRREVLKFGAYALGALGAAGLVAGSAEAQVAKKAAQAAVGYQGSPNSGKHCALCQHFQAPSSCRVVEGTISPNGYCKIFSKKG
ncbi:high potential iron sulfur protein [Rhodomicrobium lacus]|uniref:high potential iron sulfur protein n=1 Tax=Rhodomicrobium TaxID=1068 RepID=UPI0026E3B4C6|nr:high potential iron sulfur protein [Rhodomicrobium lacus]WKW50935.1 high potential iron sulfur protein [Rhodomicrobium lacus]